MAEKVYDLLNEYDPGRIETRDLDEILRKVEERLNAIVKQVDWTTNRPKSQSAAEGEAEADTTYALQGPSALPSDLGLASILTRMSNLMGGGPSLTPAGSSGTYQVQEPPQTPGASPSYQAQPPSQPTSTGSSFMSQMLSSITSRMGSGGGGGGSGGGHPAPSGGGDDCCREFLDFFQRFAGVHLRSLDNIEDHLKTLLGFYPITPGGGGSGGGTPRERRTRRRPNWLSMIGQGVNNIITNLAGNILRGNTQVITGVGGLTRDLGVGLFRGGSFLGSTAGMRMGARLARNVGLNTRLGAGLARSAGVAAGTVGGVLAAGGALVAGFGQLAGAAVIVSQTLKQWSTNLHNMNMEFADFSVAMSGVKLRQSLRDIQLSRERGDRRATDAERLAQVRHEANKERGKFEDIFSSMVTTRAVQSEKLSRAIFKILNDIFDAMPKRDDIEKARAKTTKIGAHRVEAEAAELIEAVGLERWWKKHGRPRRFQGK